MPIIKHLIIKTMASEITDPFLNHIFRDVLQADRLTHPARLTLDSLGVETIFDFLSLTKDDLQSASWLEKDKKTSPSVSCCNTLVAVQSWFREQGNPDPTIFYNLDSDILLAYRLEMAAAPNLPDAGAPFATPGPPPTPITSTPRSTAPVLTTADEFRKGVKRDITAFKTFKERRHWNSWHRVFRATAIAQGLDQVLDHSYVPSNDAETALFALLQSYAFAVLSTVLLEPECQALVRSYSGPHVGSKEGDAQSLYKDVVQVMSAGIYAQTRRSTLEQQIITTRLDGHWNKGICAFLTHFDHRVKDIQDLRDPGDTSSYNDSWCITSLKTALSTHRDMTAFVNNHDSSRATLKAAFAHSSQSIPAETYQSFMDALRNHATILDMNHSNRRRANTTDRRNAPGRGRNASSGRQPARGGRGGRGGRGQGRSQGRSYTPGSDVTDPGIRLPDSVYRTLTQDQRRRRWERQQAARGATVAVHSATSAPAAAPASSVSVPGAVALPDDASAAPSVVTAATQPPPGSVLRHMMSSASARTTATAASTDSITINGVTYRRANLTHRYRVNDTHAAPVHGSLIDGGANGGLVGSDARILETDLIATADVIGVTDDVLPSLPIVQAAARVDTVSDGPIIVILSSYAQRSDGGRTIHSKGQLESFGTVVHDSSRAVGGSQCLVTPEGFVIPLHIRDGLPFMDMSVPSDADMDHFPHVFLCSDSPWDPTILDNEFSHANFETPAVATERRTAADSRVTDFGTIHTHSADVQSPCPPPCPIATFFSDLTRTAFAFTVAALSAFPQQLRPRLPDMDSLRPNFGWVPVDRIKATLDATTQHYRATVHHPFRKHFKSRFPAANVRRLPEWFATDTIFSRVPAHDDGTPGHGGATMLQLYAGLDSEFLAGYPMRSEKQVAVTFEDFIRTNGAPQGLMSDNAKSELHGRVKDLHRLYLIKDAQSEPHYEHQNPAERRIQDVKRMTHTIMDRVGCPSKFWLLCQLFVISLLNVLATSRGTIPLAVVTGEAVDVSAFLTFHFWQEVFFEEPNTHDERLGRWVGVAQSTGDALTYYVLSNDTQQLLVRSNVRAAKDPVFPNHRSRPPDFRSAPANPLTAGGEEPAQPILMSVADAYEDPTAIGLPKFSPDELLGLTFLRDTDTGDRIRAKVTRKIMDRDAENHHNIKFLVSCGDDTYEEIMAYNELSDIIERQHQAEADGELDTWTFEEITAHEGPLRSDSPRHKGSSYNVRIRWSDGSETWEPINLVAKDDPVSLAHYAKEHDLLETPGWKFLRRIARRAKKLQRMLNQTRRQSKNNAVRYKFGVRVPRNVKEALRFDEENGNTFWADAMKLELGQLFEYETFEDSGSHCPHGYQMIHCHMVFDVKQTGKRKARFVAGGHMTNPPKDSVYSSVVSLRSIRIVSFLAELNDLELHAADVGNAYLEAHTKERVAFRAGPEFGPLAGHVLVIKKALYGLRSSGARFHEKFADTLLSFGFTPSFADSDVWMRDAGDHYEYVCTWVDDLLVAMKDPKAFLDALQAAPHNYKLKGVGPPKYHLGGDFFRDKDGTLCYSARTYCDRLCQDYKHLFGELPKKAHSPLVKGDHPELDDSEPCGPDNIAKFQSLIGALQWTISLCRFDIANAVMTLSRYRAAPNVGHLARAQRIVGYLRQFPHGTIRYRTGIPNHELIHGEHPESYDWMHSVYGSPKEELPPNAPVPKGKPVRTTTFKDANLMHDLTTGRSVTGCLHFINQTPVDWFSKRQGQVETATYGSEFVAARIATEQIMDLRYTLRMLGVPLDGPAWLFGDNQSVVTSSTIPHSQLAKRWNALSYHRVREAIAAGIIRFHHVDGKENPSDVLTKPLDHATAFPLVEPLLFWKGDTAKSGAAIQPEGSVNSPIESAPVPGTQGDSSIPGSGMGSSAIDASAVTSTLVAPANLQAT